ncbi:MAG: dihydroorotase [Prevotella sp.]|nr:dihydroorotase [Prevotella sp.]
MKTLIKNALIVNEGRSFKGYLLIDDDRIADIQENQEYRGDYNTVVDASGCFVLPGIIDDHVHFRDPGLTHKADITSESRAAAFGGVTSYLDMPNTIPQTTTLEALEDKYKRAADCSAVNYGFFFGATNDNVNLFTALNPHQVPGIKLFMGSSTGNMLVDRRESLQKIFREATLPVMVHCEDAARINENMKKAKERYGDDPPVELHPQIRDVEACYQSTALAVNLAKTYGTQLHVAHVTTAKELSLFGDNDRITAEVVVAHLVFSSADYQSLGTRIKCNPAVKSADDRDALRKALTNGKITTVGTDHAPHLLSEKEGGAARAVSGMPMIQFSLVSMLELVDEGVLPIERLVQLMCHQPASLFEIRDRGYLRKGYKADIVIVSPNNPWILTPDCIQSKCGWSPLEGHTFNWKVMHTFCNGHHLFNQGVFDETYRGEALAFR